ncbi:MAG: DUF1566 domain-containing protein, partial [Gammaproteobacteria bacterium]
MRLGADGWSVARISVLLCLFCGPAALAADPSLVLADGGIKFPDGTVQSTAAVTGSAPVADTGQTTCWDGSGTPITCAGTGQDDELQAGVAWPTPRFTLNGDGTVTDRLTGLIWLQDANCFGEELWINALGEVASLNSGSVTTCTNYVAGTFDDWRVPNVRELASLIDYGRYSPALSMGHPFVGVQSDYYWTSSTDVSNTGYGWSM